MIASLTSTTRMLSSYFTLSTRSSQAVNIERMSIRLTPRWGLSTPSTWRTSPICRSTCSRSLNSKSKFRIWPWLRTGRVSARDTSMISPTHSWTISKCRSTLIFESATLWSSLMIITTLPQIWFHVCKATATTKTLLVRLRIVLCTSLG